MKRHSVTGTEQPGSMEKYARIACSYLDRIAEQEVPEAVKCLSKQHLAILFQTAITCGKYRLCALLQKAAMSAFINGCDERLEFAE